MFRALNPHWFAGHHGHRIEEIHGEADALVLVVSSGNQPAQSLSAREYVAAWRHELRVQLKALDRLVPKSAAALTDAAVGHLVNCGLRVDLARHARRGEEPIALIRDAIQSDLRATQANGRSPTGPTIVPFIASGQPAEISEAVLAYFRNAVALGNGSPVPQHAATWYCAALSDAAAACLAQELLRLGLLTERGRVQVRIDPTGGSNRRPVEYPDPHVRYLWECQLPIAGGHWIATIRFPFSRERPARWWKFRWPRLKIPAIQAVVAVLEKMLAGSGIPGCVEALTTVHHPDQWVNWLNTRPVDHVLTTLGACWHGLNVDLRDQAVHRLKLIVAAAPLDEPTTLRKLHELSQLAGDQYLANLLTPVLIQGCDAAVMSHNVELITQWIPWFRPVCPAWAYQLQIAFKEAPHDVRLLSLLQTLLDHTANGPKLAILGDVALCVDAGPGSWIAARQRKSTIRAWQRTSKGWVPVDEPSIKGEFTFCYENSLGAPMLHSKVDRPQVWQDKWITAMEATPASTSPAWVWDKDHWSAVGEQFAPAAAGGATHAGLRDLVQQRIRDSLEHAVKAWPSRSLLAFLRWLDPAAEEALQALLSVRPTLEGDLEFQKNLGASLLRPDKQQVINCFRRRMSTPDARAMAAWTTLCTVLP